MFHPHELTRLGKRNRDNFRLFSLQYIRSHLSSGKGNAILDLDKQIYGTAAPSFKACSDIMGESLRQLHINDGRGTYPSGEGLMLGEGEIPVIPVLRHIHYRLLTEP